MAAVLVTLVVSLLELSVVPVVGLVVSLLEVIVFLPAFFASFKKFSFTFFHNIFPVLASCINTFWVFVFFNFLRCFVHVYFKVQRKRVEINMDLIPEHPVFELEKLQEPLENSLYTCFKCGSHKIFSIPTWVYQLSQSHQTL